MIFSGRPGCTACTVGKAFYCDWLIATNAVPGWERRGDLDGGGSFGDDAGTAEESRPECGEDHCVNWVTISGRLAMNAESGISATARESGTAWRLWLGYAAMLGGTLAIFLIVRAIGERMSPVAADSGRDGLSQALARGRAAS